MPQSTSSETHLSGAPSPSQGVRKRTNSGGAWGKDFSPEKAEDLEATGVSTVCLKG